MNRYSLFVCAAGANASLVTRHLSHVTARRAPRAAGAPTSVHPRKARPSIAKKERPPFQFKRSSITESFYGKNAGDLADFIHKGCQAGYVAHVDHNGTDKHTVSRVE